MHTFALSLMTLPVLGEGRANCRRIRLQNRWATLCQAALSSTQSCQPYTAPTRCVAFAHQLHSQQSPRSWRHASWLFAAKKCCNAQEVVRLGVRMERSDDRPSKLARVRGGMTPSVAVGEWLSGLLVFLFRIPSSSPSSSRLLCL